MFKNHKKIALRNLQRNTQFSLIIMAGLALGTAVSLLILLYAASEWGTNRFIKNYDNLYRADILDKDGHADYYLPPGFAPAIKNKLPGIKDYVTIAEEIGSGTISMPAENTTERKLFGEEKINYTNGEMLNVFGLSLVEGNPSLKEPSTVALSETNAQKFLGSKHALGKIITVNNQFGITPYTVTAVLKDIPGIRKVLGASISDITGLLSKDLIKLVLIAIIIASPVAWRAMHSWLQSFAFRTEMQWWIFLLAGMEAVVIAMVTISFQSIKAALMNPVKNLRTE